MTSLFMQLTARFVSPVAVAFAGYLLLRGYHSPGGGFVAAIVVGLTVVLRYWALGPQSIERLVRLGVGNLVGVGLGLMLATGAAGWWWGEYFLEVAVAEATLPVLGHVSLHSTLLFEFGVMLAVVAVVVAVIRELGGDEEQ